MIDIHDGSRYSMIAWMFDKMIEVKLDNRITDLEVSNRVQFKQIYALKSIARKTHLRVEQNMPGLGEYDMKFFSKLCKARQNSPAKEWITPTKRYQTQKVKSIFMGDLISKFDDMYTRYWRDGIDMPQDYEVDIIQTDRDMPRDSSRESKQQDFIETFRSDHLPTVITPVEIRNKQIIESLELMKSVGDEALKRGSDKNDQPAVIRLMQDIKFKLSIIDKEISTIKAKNLLSKRMSSHIPHKFHKDCWRSNRHDNNLAETGRRYQTERKTNPDEINKIVERLYYSAKKKADKEREALKPHPPTTTIALSGHQSPRRLPNPPSSHPTSLRLSALSMRPSTIARPGPSAEAGNTTALDIESLLGRILDYTKHIEASRDHIKEQMKDTNARDLIEHIQKVKDGFVEVKHMQQITIDKSERVKKIMVEE